MSSHRRLSVVAPAIVVGLSLVPGCDLFGRKGCTNSYFPSELSVALEHDEWAEGEWGFKLEFDGRTVSCAITLGAEGDSGDTGLGDRVGGGELDTAVPSWQDGTCDDPSVWLVQTSEDAVESIELWDLAPEEITMYVSYEGSVISQQTFAPTYASSAGETSSCTGGGRAGYVTASF